MASMEQECMKCGGVPVPVHGKPSESGVRDRFFTGPSIWHDVIGGTDGG